MWRLVLLGVFVACSDRATSSSPPGPGVKPEPPRAVAVRYGDCAPATVAFESGPRPQRFDPTRIDSPSPIYDPAGGVRDSRGANPRSIEAQPLRGVDQDDQDEPPPPDASPRMLTRPTSLGVPTVASGALDVAVVRRYLKRNVGKLDACGYTAAQAKRTYSGVYALSFTILPDGGVAPGASAPGPDPETAACLAAVLQAITYPKPQDGATVQAQASLTFRPPYTAEDVAAGAQAFDAAYVAGATSPLRAVDRELAACLEAHGGAAGVGVIELAPTGARLHGVGSKDLAACVSKLSLGGEALRCGFAYGDEGARAVVGVDLAGPIPTAADVMSLVSDTLAKRTTSEGLSVTGPVVVRPTGATPMATVTRVLGELRKASADPVLALEKNGAWTLLDPVLLPVTPVPRGTGARWDRHLSRQMSFGLGPDRPLDHKAGSDPRIVSLHIQADQFRLGSVAASDTVASSDRDRFVKLLGLYANHADVGSALQIAADATIRYDQVVSVIEAARAAGFISYSVVDVDELIARPDDDGPPAEGP